MIKLTVQTFWFISLIMIFFKQDVSGGAVLEEEVMTEDSLSNDEYECASPDDISLPPLAETPESIAVQSDIEESFCFSSHSLHINQYSQQCHTLPEHSGTASVPGAVQHTESSNTERCSTPPTCLHSSARSELEHITLFFLLVYRHIVKSSKVMYCRSTCSHAVSTKQLLSRD